MHSTEMVEGMTGAMRWIADRQAGKPIKRGCFNMTRTEESATGARQGITFKGLFNMAMAYSGLPIGPNYLTDMFTKFPARWVNSEASAELQ
jgi:hypothetical protein